MRFAFALVAAALAQEAAGLPDASRLEVAEPVAEPVANQALDLQAQPLAWRLTRPALSLGLAPTGAVWPLPVSTNPSSAADSLARAVAQSAQAGWLERGVATAKEALAECIKGDYPGGGMGLFSMPYLRPSATADHCRR